MEATTLVAEPLLARAKSAEVFGGLWYVVGVELEDDSGWWACVGQGVRVKVDGKRGYG